MRYSHSHEKRSDNESVTAAVTRRAVRNACSRLSIASTGDGNVKNSSMVRSSCSDWSKKRTTTGWKGASCVRYPPVLERDFRVLKALLGGLLCGGSGLGVGGGVRVRYSNKRDKHKCA